MSRQPIVPDSVTVHKLGFVVLACTAAIDYIIEAVDCSLVLAIPNMSHIVHCVIALVLVAGARPPGPTYLAAVLLGGMEDDFQKYR